MNFSSRCQALFICARPTGGDSAPPLAIQAFFLPRMAPEDLLISKDKRIGGLARLNSGGLLLRYNLIGLRLAQRLALSAAVSALATAGLSIGMTKPALAEFEIQEVGVETGEVELEYRAPCIGAFLRLKRKTPPAKRAKKRGRRGRRRRGGRRIPQAEPRLRNPVRHHRAMDVLDHARHRRAA